MISALSIRHSYYIFSRISTAFGTIMAYGNKWAASSEAVLRRQKRMRVTHAACAWRIHKITRQSASGITRDSASAGDTK
jgi:hypothetical protein